LPVDGVAVVGALDPFSAEQIGEKLLSYCFGLCAVDGDYVIVYDDNLADDAVVYARIMCH
jgi:hypothetical protein